MSDETEIRKIANELMDAAIGVGVNAFAGLIPKDEIKIRHEVNLDHFMDQIRDFLPSHQQPDATPDTLEKSGPCETCGESTTTCWHWGAWQHIDCHFGEPSPVKESLTTGPQADTPQQPAAIPDTLPEDDMRYLTAKELGIHPSRITAIDGKSITISSQPSPQANGYLKFNRELKFFFNCWVGIQDAIVDGNFRKLLVSAPQAETLKDAASDETIEYITMLAKACAELKRRNGNIENSQLQCWYSVFPASNKKEQGE